MSSTYSTNLAIELIGSGDQAGAWGTTTNSNLGTLVEQAISGYVTQAITDGADTVITIPNGASGVARNMIIECTGALTAGRNLIVPTNKKLYFIYNNTTGSQAVTVKVSGQTGVSVPNGAKVILTSNGTDIVVATNYMASLTLGTALPVASGGTGSITASAARTALGIDYSTIVALIYPVGSIYTNASVATNPATLLGFGTWTAFGAGRVPVGDGGGFAAGAIGGSADATLVSHNHTGSSTSANTTSHFHDFTIGRAFGATKPGSAGFGIGPYGLTNVNGYEDTLNTYYDLMGHVHNLNIAVDGTSATNANLQPYIVVYMWQRTA